MKPEAAFNRRMRQTARPVVWEGAGAQSPVPDPIKNQPKSSAVVGLAPSPGGFSNKLLQTQPHCLHAGEPEIQPDHVNRDETDFRLNTYGHVSRFFHT